MRSKMENNNNPSPEKILEVSETIANQVASTNASLTKGFKDIQAKFDNVHKQLTGIRDEIKSINIILTNMGEEMVHHDHRLVSCEVTLRRITGYPSPE